MIRIKGVSPGPDGRVEISDKDVTGEFKLNLKNLSTGIEMRDRHMKEKYLEIATNPEATLIIQTLSIKDHENSQDLLFHGTLSLHGKIKPVSGVVSFETVADLKKTHAEFKIRLSDFGITIPSYAGITVADEVQLKMDINLRRE
jgi:polyisoprenoid-binding protein YceI